MRLLMGSAAGLVWLWTSSEPIVLPGRSEGDFGSWVLLGLALIPMGIEART